MHQECIKPKFASGRIDVSSIKQPQLSNDMIRVEWVEVADGVGDGTSNLVSQALDGLSLDAARGGHYLLDLDAAERLERELWAALRPRGPGSGFGRRLEAGLRRWLWEPAAARRGSGGPAPSTGTTTRPPRSTRRRGAPSASSARSAPRAATALATFTSSSSAAAAARRAASPARGPSRATRSARARRRSARSAAASSPRRPRSAT